MLLVELIRLVIVLAFTAGGYQLAGERSGWLEIGSSPETRILVFAVVGAGLGYVIGGMVGRSLLSAVGAVERKVERVSGAELVVGSIGFLLGAGAAALVSWPVLIFVPVDYLAYSIVAVIFLFFCYAGFRIATGKRFDVLNMMGLSQTRNFLETPELGGGLRVLDSSAIIDGRIIDVANAGFVSGHVICPRFVLAEIQSIADSGDPARRARGRRGLEVLDALQGISRLQLEVSDDDVPEFRDVDAKLVALAKKINGVLVTTDFNLHRVAELQGVPVLNINTLAASLQAVVLPGEEVSIEIVKEGKQKDQGVGYLEDGTMVVVESASRRLGEVIQVSVTSVLQTPAGKMLFAVPADQTQVP